MHAYTIIAMATSLAFVSALPYNGARDQASSYGSVSQGGVGSVIGGSSGSDSSDGNSGIIGGDGNGGGASNSGDASGSGGASSSGGTGSGQQGCSANQAQGCCNGSAPSGSGLLDLLNLGTCSFGILDGGCGNAQAFCCDMTANNLVNIQTCGPLVSL